MDVHFLGHRYHILRTGFYAECAALTPVGIDHDGPS